MAISKNTAKRPEKKAAAKRPALKKTAAKLPSAKKSAAKRPAAKNFVMKAGAKRLVAKKAAAGSYISSYPYCYVHKRRFPAGESCPLCP